MIPDASQHDHNLDLLTAYAFGMLDPEGVLAVEQLLREHPELRTTLATLQQTVDQLPMALPDVDPPADLRERVLQHAVGRTSRPPQAQVQPTRPLVRRLLGYLGSFAVGALLIGLLGWNQLTTTRLHLDQTQQQLTTLQVELETRRQQDERLASLIAAGGVPVILAGPGGTGAVVQNVEGAVISARLPPLATEREYQVWAIADAATPVSLGTFRVDERGYGLLLVSVGKLPASQPIFAITEEPAGGSPAPTTPILVSSQT